MKFLKSACIEPMYTELPFLDRFQAAKNDGFACVEFWSWTDKDLDAVKDAADRSGVLIAGFNGDAELSLIDPAQKADYLAFLRQSLAAAKRVGRRRGGVGDHACAMRRCRAKLYQIVAGGA